MSIQPKIVTANSIFLSKISNLLKINFYYISKLIFDYCISFLLLIITLPLQIIFCIIIYLETRLNPIFIQERAVTLEKKRFNIYKIRTLYTIPEHANFLNNEVLIKHHLNAYVTPFGKFLRKTGFDELPQLINILKGNLSFIGPRPLSILDLELMKQKKFHLYQKRQLLKSKPGISGLWQIYGDREKGIKNLIEYDLQYEKIRSLKEDLFLFLMSVPIVSFAKNSDAILNTVE